MSVLGDRLRRKPQCLLELLSKAVHHCFSLILPITSVYSNSLPNPQQTVTEVEGVELMWGTKNCSLDLLNEGSSTASVRQRQERLLTGVSFLPCCCNKMSWQKQLKEDWILAHSPSWWKSQQQEPGTAGHTVLPAKKQRETEHCYSTCFPLFMQFRASVHEMVPPTFRMGLLASTNLK